MVVCLTSARFNMKADILRSTTEQEDSGSGGEWVVITDPDSNEIIRQWQEPDAGSETPDPSDDLTTFKCIARGTMSREDREVFREAYINSEVVIIKYPTKYKISLRDRVTNIRDRNNNIIWLEEEQRPASPTIFNVVAVAPILDPFGRHIENSALLERIEGQ